MEAGNSSGVEDAGAAVVLVEDSVVDVMEVVVVVVVAAVVVGASVVVMAALLGHLWLCSCAASKDVVDNLKDVFIGAPPCSPSPAPPRR